MKIIPPPNISALEWTFYKLLFLNYRGNWISDRKRRFVWKLYISESSKRKKKKMKNFRETNTASKIFLLSQMYTINKIWLEFIEISNKQMYHMLLLNHLSRESKGCVKQVFVNFG